MLIQPDRAAASQTLRHVADQLRAKWPKLSAFIDDSEADVLSHMDFPVQHRTKLHSTNPLERLNKEVKRRADVEGIFPNEGAIVSLIGAVLLEANDEWHLQHRYKQTEAMTSRSDWANDSSILSVSRPIDVAVLDCWVTDTKLAPLASSTSTILAKSASERVRRSTF